jgi:hypothetical protein
LHASLIRDFWLVPGRLLHELKGIGPLKSHEGGIL